jgi:HAD superfamily hydrolase (TIGR01509 family)
MQNIKAVLFDMDGTLVDSESLSGQALLALLQDNGIATQGLDLVQFHGVTWNRIATRLLQLFQSLASDSAELASDIEARFQVLFQTQPPELIPGAREAFVAAAGTFPRATTIVTGSESRAVEVLLDRADLRQFCVGYTSCDQYQRSKPHPESYLLAARRLGIPPESCLVFEDSKPGLQAARAAGMRCIAITCGVAERRQQAVLLADDSIDDFTTLPADFFDGISRPG